MLSFNTITLRTLYKIFFSFELAKFMTTEVLTDKPQVAFEL